MTFNNTKIIFEKLTIPIVIISSGGKIFNVKISLNFMKLQT